MQVSEDTLGRAIRTKRWKYGVVAPDGNPAEDPSSERYVEASLYDLEQDPHERINLAGDPAHENIRVDLRKRLKSWMVRAGEAEPIIEPSPVDAP